MSKAFATAASKPGGAIMSTSEGEPSAYVSLGRELADGATETQFLVQGNAPSLTAQAFAGWDLMTDAVAETDPRLASLMSSGGLLARAAFEEQVPRLLDDLAELFRDGGLARSSGDDLLSELARRLQEPQCPFSWEWLRDQHQSAVGSYTAGLPEILRSGHGLWQAVNAAVRKGLEPESAGAQEPVEPLPKRPRGEWRIIATVERPGKIGRPGSLLCCTPQPGWRRHVRLEETTYQGIPHRSTAIGAVKFNEWVVLAEDGRDFDYRAPAEFPIGLQIPPEFAQALQTDETVSGAAYFVQLDVSEHRQEMVLEFVNQHEEAIRTAALAALTGAAGLIPGGLLVPLGVLNMIPGLIIGTVRAILNRRVARTVLPSWLVQHTVIKVGDQSPTSAVLLHSPEQPEATLVGAQLIDGKMQAVRDYDDFNVPQLWPRGRILNGATLPEAADADLPMVPPLDLCTWVDVHRHPVVWSDAWESGQEPTHGFRVLLPFSPPLSPRTLTQPKGPHYVAALRVEVYFRRQQWTI